MKEKIDSFITEQERLKREFQENAQKAFKEITTEFFEANPGVSAIIWTQYSPYFNDGDECVFSVNPASFTNATGEDLNDIHCDQYDGDNEDVWVEDYEWGKPETHEGVDPESCKAFNELICSRVMSDVMQMMFENHSRVVATREGFEFDSYDHD